MVRVLSTVLFLAVTWGALAGPSVVLAGLEGEVSVLRSGILIPSEKVGEGFALEPFDTLSTGTLGRAEVRVPSALGISAALRVDPSSSLYVEFSPALIEQTVGVELLAGAVGVRVSSVTGSSAIEVRTAVATFSGQGPVFRVAQAPSGDLLMMPSSGKVLARLSDRTLFLEPGLVLQTLTLDGSVQTLPVNAMTLESFEVAWSRQRGQTFRDQTAVYFRALATRYQSAAGLFVRAWDRYNRESAGEPKAIQAATTNLRRAAGPLERVLVQIRALKGRFDEGGLPPSLELTRGYSARDFFRQSTAEETSFITRLGQARGFYKALADRNGGRFPASTDGAPITWTSDFFH